MTTKQTTRRTRGLTVLAATAMALAGLLPASASASAAQNGSDSAHRARGYVCDRLERHHHDSAVGSGRCHALHAPRHGRIHGTFTIRNRRGQHHRVVCVARRGHTSGYANTPRWVRGEHCRRV